MVMAGAIKVGALGGKPTDLAKVVKVLVRGSGRSKSENAEDSEYIDEQWWGKADEEVDADGRGGNDT